MQKTPILVPFCQHQLALSPLPPPQRLSGACQGNSSVTLRQGLILGSRESSLLHFKLVGRDWRTR